MAAKKATKVSGADRYLQLLECGAKLASKHGVINVTRRMVANACKVSEPLVTSYMGNTGDAQKLYAKHAKKLKLPLPTKEEAEAIGAKLRAHGPRKAPVKRTTKRSVREVKAIKRAVAKVTVKKSKTAPAKSARGAAAKTTNVKATGAANTGSPGSARKSAARAPKAPPPLPPLPPAPIADALPPLPPPPPVLH